MKKTDLIKFRVTPSRKAELQREAAYRQITLTELIEGALENELGLRAGLRAFVSTTSSGVLMREALEKANAALLGTPPSIESLLDADDLAVIAQDNVSGMVAPVPEYGPDDMTPEELAAAEAIVDAIEARKAGPQCSPVAKAGCTRVDCADGTCRPGNAKPADGTDVCAHGLPPWRYCPECA